MWPTINDYVEAIQNPHLCFGLPHGQSDLRLGQVEFNELLGQPQLWSGASDCATSWSPWPRCASARPTRRNQVDYVGTNEFSAASGVDDRPLQPAAG